MKTHGNSPMITSHWICYCVVCNFKFGNQTHIFSRGQSYGNSNFSLVRDDLPNLYNQNSLGLDRDKKIWFQQDGATINMPRTAILDECQESVDDLRHTFLVHLIS